MAVTAEGESDSVPLANDEVITKPEEGTDYGWYAEFELRGYMKREFRGSDRDVWVEPNLQRAQYHHPVEHHETHLTDGCSRGRYRGDELPDLNSDHEFCRTTPEAYEQALREWPYFEVYDDRIVVPLEVMEQIDDEPVDGHQYSTEFVNKIINPLIAFMPIIENTNREHTGHGTDYDGEFDNFQTGSNHPLSDGFMDEYEGLLTDRPDPRPVYVRAPPDHPMTELTQIFNSRKRDERTLLASIVARDAQTGTGKTTLAVQIAKTWDQNGWTADRATLDPDTYAEKYTDEATPSKSCLILDEAEQAADNRRSMSDQNVTLSHLWATMRFREIYSILTLPSASMLDKRLKELADLYIVVIERGVAVAYQTKIDDTEGENYLRRLHRIRWQPLDDDPEYQKLTQKKADRMKNYAENYTYGDDEDDVDPEQVRQEAEMEKRNALIKRMARLDYPHKEIAEIVGLDRSTVSRIIRNK